MALQLTPQYTGAVKANLIECDVTGTPTVGGLYVKQLDSPAIYRASKATETLVTDHFDRTDPSNLVAVPLEKATLPNIDNNQWFVKDNLEEASLYEEPLTEPCYTDVNIYNDFVEPLFDENESRLFDETNDPLYALKDTTERVV